MTQLSQLHIWLENLHPATPWALLTAAILVLQWGVRRAFPDLWERVANLPPNFEAYQLDGLVAAARKAWQALPSVLIGALYSAAVSGGSFRELWIGALSGVLAPVSYEIAKLIRDKEA